MLFFTDFLERIPEFIEAPSQGPCRIALRKSETHMVPCVVVSSVYIHSTVSIGVQYVFVLFNKSLGQRCIGERNFLITYMTVSSPFKPSTSNTRAALFGVIEIIDFCSASAKLK
jgi:hypothetical protein